MRSRSRAPTYHKTEAAIQLQQIYTHRDDFHLLRPIMNINFAINKNENCVAAKAIFYRFRSGQF